MTGQGEICYPSENSRPPSFPDRYLEVLAFQDSGRDLNVYIVHALSTGNGGLKHDEHDQQKQKVY